MPQRASLRIKGIASDGTSVADELRNGQIVVKDSKDPSVWGPFPRYQDAPEPKPREMPTGAPRNYHLRMQLPSHGPCIPHQGAGVTNAVVTVPQGPGP